MFEALFKYFSEIFLNAISFLFKVFVDLNVFDFDFTVKGTEDFMGFNNIVGMILGSVRVFDFGVVHFIHHRDGLVFNFLCHFLDLGFSLFFKSLILFSEFFFILSLRLCDVVKVEIFLTKLKDFFDILPGNKRKFTYL